MVIELSTYEADILLDAILYAKMAEERVLALDPDIEDRQAACQRVLRLDSIGSRLEAAKENVEQS